MKKVYVWTFLALLAIYIVLAFALPSDPGVLDKYDLSVGQARLLNLTIVVPVTLIYLAALYGFVRIKDYAAKVSGTKEGPHFNKLANGLMVLAYGLPVTSIISSFASYIRHAEPHMISDITIVRGYVALAFAFVATLLIGKGAQGLYGTLKQHKIRDGYSFYSLAAPIALAAVYTWLIVSQGQNNPGGEPYFLPNWLIIPTIAIPYIYAWCVGGWAAVQLHKYQGGVKGVIYKRALDNLAKGIAAIILISILLQFMTTVSGLLNRLDLTPLLLFIYVLLACYAVGYFLVARGAKKLEQLEEI